MRKLRAFSGLVACASLDPASNVMSWSRNWPKNVVPAVCVGLFGLFALKREVDDQRLRPGGQRVGGIEQAAGLSELDQGGLDRRRLGRERRQLEDPSEVIAPLRSMGRRRRAVRSER